MSHCQDCVARSLAVTQAVALSVAGWFVAVSIVVGAVIWRPSGRRP